MTTGISQPTGRRVHSLRLSIGGVRIVLTSSFPFTSPPFPPEYGSFLDSPLHEGFDLSVRMMSGIPDPAKWGVFTHASRTWRLFLDGSTRRIVWDGNTPDHPLWLLEFLPGTNTVTVYCGERLLAESQGGGSLLNPMHYPLDQMLLLYQLADRGMGIVHSAGLILGDKCIVAAGRSGAGKSTLSRCWAARHGTASLLSDDRVIMGGVSGDGGFKEAYGSPWPGELGVALNTHKPVHALVFLAKAKVNQLVPLDSREAIERLFPVTSIPWFDPEYLTLALANVEKWLTDLPAYEFQFTPDDGAVSVLEDLAGAE